MRTKITFILLLSALICGQTMYAEDDIFGTLYDNKDIFALYDKTYDNAVEITEYRAERLFEILQDDKVDLFLDRLSKQKPSLKKKIIDACSSPLHDEIDLQKCIENIQRQKNQPLLQKQIIEQLKLAIQKYT